QLDPRHRTGPLCRSHEQRGSVPMGIDRHRWAVPLMGAILLAIVAGWGVARAVPDAGRAAQPATAQRDGQRDFHFEFGSWKAHVRRLVKPLTGSSTWVELDGTSVVRKLWDGEGNVGELDISGPSGHIQGVTVRLYNPRARQWSVSFSSRTAGTQGQAPPRPVPRRRGGLLRHHD